MDWINDNPEKIPSEEEASQSIGYERNYLSKLFKYTIGITYSEYCTIIKMGFAAAELRDTEKPVFEIAELLGYAGTEAFTHAFTNAFGCCPTDYRKNPGSISVPFFKIISNDNEGVITMKKLIQQT